MSFDQTRVHACSPRRDRRRELSIACLSAALLLGAPAGALALDVTLQAGVLEIAARPGEVNRIEIAPSAQGISITDSVRIARPQACRRENANTVVCRSTDVTRVRVLAGDRDDAVLARNGAIEEIECGSGLDVVTADGDDVVAADCEQVDRRAPDADPILVIQPVTGPEPVPFDLDTAAMAPAGSPPPTARPATSRAAPPRLRRITVIVRLAGTLTARGARVSLLSVKGAPRGATIDVSSRGHGCSPAVRRTAASAGLRFRTFQRALGSGAVIEVAVRPAGAAIGTHTRFLIRRGAAPVRVSSCLMPGVSRPVRCPRS